MGTKKYSASATAEAVIEKIRKGDITGNTAHRELIQIAEEWKGTSVGREAKSMIDMGY